MIGYAFDGNLLDNNAYHAIIPNMFYDLILNSILVQSILTITAAIGVNPNLTTVGPCTPGDANTKTIRVRRIVPIPFAYAPIFLCTEVNPCYYFETIHPQIVTDQQAYTCSALHNSFQVAITIPAAGAPSILINLHYL